MEPYSWGGQGNNQKDRDTQYQNVYDCFSSYENVEVIRAKAEDVFDMFEDESLDYVYIDGEHTYVAVLRDLTHYFPKVKVGGHLIGDDYDWQEIKKAVSHFLQTHKNECQFFVHSFQGPGPQFVIKRTK